EEGQVTALLSLVSGFATPFLLASGADRPFGLFGYLLMLNAGIVYVAARRGWPRVALAALLGTVLYQVGWIGFRMGPERLPLGLVILGVLGLLFAFGSRTTEERRLEWRVTQAAALLLPFAFTSYVAFDTRFSMRLLPVGLLLLLLSVAAAWLARAQRTYQLSLGAAAAG